MFYSGKSFMMKLSCLELSRKVLLLCFILLFPFNLDARGQAGGRSQASGRSQLALASGVTDSFNRAPSTTLGGNWREIESDTEAFEIVTMGAVTIGSTVAEPNRVGLAFFEAPIKTDQFVQMTFESRESGYNPLGGMTVRMDTASTLANATFYMARFQPSPSGVVVSKVVNGDMDSITPFSNIIPLNITDTNDGDIFRLEVIGSTITIYRQDASDVSAGFVQLDTTTDPTAILTGGVGMALTASPSVVTANTVAVWKDFSTGIRQRSQASNRVQESC